MVSVVINTVAGSEHARSRVSSGGASYDRRAKLLRERILPPLLGDVRLDVVLSGSWEPTTGARVVDCHGTTSSVVDALAQRDRGAAASVGDVCVFLHDDHQPGGGFFDRLLARVDDPSWDVLVPARWAWDPVGEPRLCNNGERDGYAMGHACVVRRWVVNMVPWVTATQAGFAWDVDWSQRAVRKSAKFRWVRDLAVWDLEAEMGATPWK